MNPSSFTTKRSAQSGRGVFFELRDLLLLLSVTLILLTPTAASALLVGDDGRIEPIVVQIKESLRTSTDLDNRLAELASLQTENELETVNWWAGRKLLVMFSFPKGETEDQAENIISALQKSSAVEKVVVQSASNLEFKAADFERSYASEDAIPDAARRGFDVDRLLRPKTTYDPKSELPLHSANRLIVRWKDEYVWDAAQTGFDQRFADFNTQAECAVTAEWQHSDHDLTQVLEFDPVKYSVLDQLLLYQANDLVDYVQPDYTYESQTVPNDPIYASQQWSLPKISAPSAWSLPVGTGSDSVVVAIADSGANVANTNGHVIHPDFATNLWSLQNNGDNHNFISNPYSTNVYDGNGHGSNVASIAGAQGNNGLYMSGVAWNVSLMHLKVLDDGDPIFHTPATGTSASISQGIDYAWQHGAAAVNLSSGSVFMECDPPPDNDICVPVFDLAISDSLMRARGGNTVAVCSAGNNNENIDSIFFTPAALLYDNIISVAASDQNDARPSFSNYGVQKVDLAAPGVSIYGLKATYNGDSNDLDNNYSIYTGTSQAAPHVTGTIALVKAKFGWENYHGLRDRVLMGTDDLNSFSTLVRTGGRLNANKALQPRTLIRNLSTRARVENGDRIMIGGFTIGGNGAGTLKVAIRGLGPSLPSLGVAKLNNPTLQLNNSAGNVIYSNSDWMTLPAAQLADLSANNLNPPDSREAAMVQTLAPGSYTVFLQSQDAVFGVGLFEIYELQGGTNQKTRLLNVSTRCLVRTGNEQAIAGTILGDPSQSTNTTIPKRSLLMFGKGPSLPSSIPGRLANPLLTLKDSAGTQMSANDSWANATASVVKAANSLWTNVAAPVDELTEAELGPTSPLESALWPILKSGTYTVTLSGVSGGTGVGLLEMYEY